jgi:hypothetical protein
MDLNNDNMPLTTFPTFHDRTIPHCGPHTNQNSHRTHSPIGWSIAITSNLISLQYETVLITRCSQSKPLLESENAVRLVRCILRIHWRLQLL